jgi:FtsP/CotA-like multicopper oxidase with cupredoxin domain
MTSQSPTDQFSTETAGLPACVQSDVVELLAEDEFELRIAPVTKEIGDATVRMLAYNESIPGPTLRVPQGSEVVVNVVNEGDLEATVHWHGVRLENRYDGTHETQVPMQVGESFSYRVQFPDPGVYWYHPHIREDYGQEMGLYGNILVVPTDPDYWPPVNREVLLTLDDVLIEDGKIASFSRTETTYVAMGRFGNTLLVGGEPDLKLKARLGEVVRLYLTNTANTRVFNVALEGAQMKLVGGDSGRCEREEFVEEVLLAPSERAVVDVLFDKPGTLTLGHKTPDRSYPLAAITVSGDRVVPSLGQQYEALRTNADMVDERERIVPYLTATPDKTLAFVAEMDMGVPEGAVVYTCPMHPEVVSPEEGSCPKCGMKLLATAVTVTYACPMHPDVVSAEEGSCPKCGMKLLGVAVTYACPMHPEVVSETSDDRCPKCGMKLLPSQFVAGAGHQSVSTHKHDGESHAHNGEGSGHGHHGDDHGQAHKHEGHGHESHAEGHAHEQHAEGHGHAVHGEGRHAHDAAGGIEWEDDMVEVNKMTTPANMRWKIVDRTTGTENHAIDWRFQVGDQVKMRLINEMDSDHPMHHPFHIHGAGRFLVLSRDGVGEPNLVWKDTVLVRTGETVDILLDVTNPGVWMAHCHIAEHHESGMMFSFHVDPKSEPSQ